MDDSPDTAWSNLMSLIQDDNAEAISASALALQNSGLLEGNHPLDELKRTPVMLAYWYGHLNAAIALVNAGAQYQAQDTKDRSVTWYAQNFGKGANEAAMSRHIAITTTRISMQAVIRAKANERVGEVAPARTTKKRMVI